MFARGHFRLFTLLVLLGTSSSVFSIEEKIFDLNGTLTLSEIEQVLKKMPDVKITRQEGAKGHISIEFPVAQTFTPQKNDLFERITTNSGNDQPDREFLIADPKTGRIFYLNSEFKVYKMDLVKPWGSKNARPLKEILKDQDHNPIIKKTKVKKEVKK